MKLLSAIALLACAVPLASYAQSAACMIESKANIQGKIVTIGECIENTEDVPEQALDQLCEWARQSSAHIVKHFGGTAPIKSKLGKCPPKPAGICKGNYGAPLNSYFYNLPPGDLKEKQQNCLATGGAWQ
jgi:hypothetical protein